MVNKYTSYKTVIAKLYRDLGDFHNLNHDHILEWMGEVIAQIGSRETYQMTHRICEVEDNVLKLPCDLVYLVSIYDEEQRRLRHSGTIKDLSAIPKEPKHTEEPIWISEIETQIFIDKDGNEVKRIYDTGRRGTNMRPIKFNSSEKVYTQDGGVLKFSFEKGTVILHYVSIPLDKENFPLIPDNTSLREAILYYVCMKLLGRGIKTEIGKIYNYEQLRQMYERYMGYAMASMTFPSPDMLESWNQKLNDLMPNFKNYIKSGEFAEQDFNREAYTNTNSIQNSYRNLSRVI